MRRRIVREVKKPEQVKPVVKDQVKEVKKEIKPKEVKEIIKKAQLKTLSESDISTNKLGKYNFVDAENTESVESEKFLQWLFTEVLTYEDLTVDDETYHFISTESGANNYQKVNEYDLKGILVAGSVVYYDCGNFVLGMVVDKVLDQRGNTLSAINIEFNGKELPDDSVDKLHIAWMMACDGSAFPAIKGTTVANVKEWLDSSKEQYGRIEPINKGQCAEQEVQIVKFKPSRGFTTQPPIKEYIPTTPMGEVGNYNMGCSATGYIFIYTKEKGKELEQGIKLDLIYVRVPVIVTGTPDCLELAKLVKYMYKGTGDNKEENVTLYGSCVNVLQVPRKSAFYQENFGDSDSNSVIPNGKCEVLYPSVYWDIYGIDKIEK